jgi:hypothetical protein
MSKQPKKNKPPPMANEAELEKKRFKEPLSLADVVELTIAALEHERQDAMFEAENSDLMPDPDIKLTDLRPIPQLTEAEKEAALNERMAATYFWPEIVNVPGATVEAKAKHLAARKADFPAHMWRKLLLDLVVDITPLDKPVPNTLVALLQDALGLPENHDVGGWPLTAKSDDNRGNPDREARECASLIDCKHIEALLTHKDKTIRSEAAPMALNELQRQVKAKLRRAPATKTLREWRENFDYWNLEQYRHQFRGRGK